MGDNSKNVYRKSSEKTNEKSPQTEEEYIVTQIEKYNKEIKDLNRNTILNMITLTGFGVSLLLNVVNLASMTHFNTNRLIQYLLFTILSGFVSAEELMFIVDNLSEKAGLNVSIRSLEDQLKINEINDRKARTR